MTNESTIATLKAAKKLIRAKKRWTTIWWARNTKGVCVKPSGRAAVQWCALGAIFKQKSPFERNAIAALQAAVPSKNSIAHFNDTHTHPEVLAVFDAAIARLEQSND